MKTRAILLAGPAAAVLIAAPSVLSQPAGEAPPAPTARQSGDLDVNSGRFLSFGGIYGELRVDCIRCHELDGSGNTSGAFPRLSDQSAWYLYESLLDYAAGLRPSDIMEPIARQLSEEEMQNLAAYYASIEDAPYPAEPEIDVQVRQHGGAIAAVGIPEQGVPACDTCHGPNGIGSPPLYPYLAGQFAPYLENQLLLWKAGRRDGDAMNVMEMIARNMTEEQIRSVSLYFSSVRPPEVTPDEEDYRDLETRPLPRADKPGRTDDMGAIPEPEPGDADIVPGAEPAAEPSPNVDLPVGQPRRPLPPGADAPSPPAEPGEGLESTTTTTGERSDGDAGGSPPAPSGGESTGD